MFKTNGDKIHKDACGRRKVYLYYTLLFALTAVMVYLPFMRAGKSFVHAKDGLYQHYNAFVYLGTYIRSIIRNLLTSHKLVIPMWEFGIGYGADILTTLSYYCIGDPFALVSVVTPVRYADIVYSILIVLRLYLAGFFFCMYAGKMHRDDFSAMCASLGYAFCGFALYAVLRHPFFATPMICLPLLLIGAEKILKKESPSLYIFMVFISCISNYYFFYQVVLILVLYVVIRCVTTDEKAVRLRDLAVVCGKFAGLALIGIAMAAVIFLPSAMAFLSSNRLNAGYQYNILYPLRYYKALAGAYIANKTPGYWTYIGLSPVVAAGAGALFIEKKGQRWLKWIIMLTTIFLLIPFFGHVFNGLGYVCNRWSFAYAFFLAYAFACMLPAIMSMEKKEKQRFIFLLVIYSAACIVFRESRREAVFMSCVILWVSVAVILNGRDIRLWLQERGIRFAESIVQCLVAAFVLLGIWCNSHYVYADEGDWDAANAHDAGGCYADITEITGLAEELIGRDDTFYRLDIHEGDYKDGGSNGGRNALISEHISTTSMYWSVLSPYIISYMAGNSAYGGANFEYRNLQSRALLLPFAAAKYYVHAGDGEYEEQADVPCGYSYLGKKVSVKGNLYTVYQSNYALPLGYTYDAYITADEYNAMKTEERQQAMLQGIVLEDSACTDIALEHSTPDFVQENLAYGLIGSDDLEIDGKNIIVKKKNAGITLQFECPPENELYVKLELSKFVPKNPSKLISGEERGAYTKWQKEKSRIEEQSWTEPERTWLEASCDGRSTGLQCFPVNAHVYDGRSEYLFNLGCSEKTRNSITLSFSEPGIYSCEGIDVIAQPVCILDECIEKLQKDTLEQIEISDNQISGVITVDDTKALCFSIPYSSGWSVYIDGQESELLQSNVMYMGVVLTEGTHRVELRYETPYLRMGFAITLAGFLVFFVITCIHSVFCVMIKRDW